MRIIPRIVWKEIYENLPVTEIRCEKREREGRLRKKIRETPPYIWMARGKVSPRLGIRRGRNRDKGIEEKLATNP